MLSTISSDTRWLSRVSAMPSAAYLDDFVRALTSSGYRRTSIQFIVRGAVHLICWLECRGQSLTEICSTILEEFYSHFQKCRCQGFKGGDKDTIRGAKLFIKRLQDLGVVAKQRDPIPVPPPLLSKFSQWMRQHRGLKDATIAWYGRVIVDVLESIGDDPARFDARSVRNFVLRRAPRYRRSKAKQVVCALRAFIRYLIAEGLCPAGLDAAIPTIAGWKLASLPRYMPTTDVDRVLNACDPNTSIGARDHAILLLLSRLGLRAGDVATLHWRDIDWKQATIEVAGKANRSTRLPLSQEVGDALLKHLTHSPSATSSDVVFLNASPPLGRPLASSGVSCVVRRAIARAGVAPRSRGAHVLRHSAATSLLAEGASLQSIGALLRHRLTDTTAIYAKVDFKILNDLARPWPGVSP
jgi:site-specific recombinase XerD